MARMVKCVKCAAMMAKGASNCPSCASPAPWNLAFCRVCRTPLARSAFRYKSHYSYVSVVDGTGGTRGGSVWIHVLCPKCGEPKPLREFIDTPHGKLLSYAGIFAGFIGMLVLGIGINGRLLTDASTEAAIEVFGGVLLALVAAGWGIGNIFKGDTAVNFKGSLRPLWILTGAAAIGVIGSVLYVLHEEGFSGMKTSATTVQPGDHPVAHHSKKPHKKSPAKPQNPSDLPAPSSGPGGADSV
jgi:hypothetical protein